MKTKTDFSRLMKKLEDDAKKERLQFNQYGHIFGQKSICDCGISSLRYQTQLKYSSNPKICKNAKVCNHCEWLILNIKSALKCKKCNIIWCCDECAIIDDAISGFLKKYRGPKEKIITCLKCKLNEGIAIGTS